MECKVVIKRGNAVVVSYRDSSGTVRTRLMSGTITDTKVGQVIDISEEQLSTGTDYGLDWDIVMPGGFCISPKELHNALADRGVYTIEDTQKRSNLVADAVNVLVKRMQVKIHKEVNKIGG